MIRKATFDDIGLIEDTYVDADTIYFLKNGQILTSGTHAQLLATCPDYKRLYEQESAAQEN